MWNLYGKFYERVFVAANKGLIQQRSPLEDRLHRNYPRLSILFARNILMFMSNRKINYPILIYCDNAGAIFLTANRESRRTKYLNTKYHFIRQYVEDKIIKFIFVMSEENLADPFTKNVRSIDFEEKFPYLTSPYPSADHGRVSNNEAYNRDVLHTNKQSPTL